MDSINIIFEKYVKGLKLSVAEDYIYVVRDDYFGDIVFSTNTTSLGIIRCMDDISDKYFNKMISVDVIKGKSNGYEYDIGILGINDYIHHYNCVDKFRKSMRILNSFKKDLIYYDSINTIYNLQKEEFFSNNILKRKADDGAGKYIYDKKIMYVAPCMLPGSKSTAIDATIYYTNGNDYYTTLFNTHKKEFDVMTLMKFICL